MPLPLAVAVGRCFPIKKSIVIGPVGMWARGPRVWSTCGPRYDGAWHSHRSVCAVHGLSTRLQLGPVRGTRTRPHIHRAAVRFASSALAQGTSGRLRRWIILRYVDWLPPDFTASRSLPFSKIRGHRPGTPYGDYPDQHRCSPNKDSPHRPDMP